VRDPSVSEREVLVDGTHRGRSFADGCRDSLGRACPDVACGEQPGMAGLKGQRSPAQHFPPPGEVLFAQGPVSEHETAFIEGRASRQPTRCRICADEGEHGEARQHGIDAPGGDMDRREGPVTVQTSDSAVGSNVDASLGLDAVDKVARHAGAQVVAADDNGDGAAGRCEKQCGLAGRVASPRDHDRGAGAEAGFHLGGRVVHAVAFEVCETGGTSSRR
jgi:hypothetical protein